MMVKHDAARVSAAIDEIRASTAQPGIVSMLTSSRDFHRDLGTHGIGAMDGKPWDYPQRAHHRELERCLDVLIEVLR